MRQPLRNMRACGYVPNTLAKISIVTPVYNQSRFLEEAICSVLTQDYLNIEYVVIDGGSTDRSVDIIRKYEDRLAYWVSEPDAGQYEAINKGFGKTTGEIMAWLNSDDKYLPWAFSIVNEIFMTCPEVKWLTTMYPLVLDEKGRPVEWVLTEGFDRRSFFRGANLPGRGWYARAFIQQESTFWRRSLWERAGGYVDGSLMFAGDFELWARFFRHADLYAVETPIGGIRRHRNQKTVTGLDQYLTEAEEILRRADGQPYGRVESVVRRCIGSAIRTRSLRRLETFPSLIRLVAARILYPTKIVIWNESGWKIVTGYVV